MLTYKIDKSGHSKASGNIKDMAGVLDEISKTLQILQESLAEHEASISTPTIDTYRQKLQHQTSLAVELTQAIAERSQQLCAASDQATKHLVAIDEHFGAALRDNAAAVPTKVQ